jgi:hypothetical protein
MNWMIVWNKVYNTSFDNRKSFDLVIIIYKPLMSQF